MQLRLSGIPTCGDEVLLHATHPTNGGKTSGGYAVKDGDTLADVASGLYMSCVHPYNFSKHFDFKLRNETITVILDNLVEVLLLIPEVKGEKTEVLTLEEL